MIYPRVRLTLRQPFFHTFLVDLEAQLLSHELCEVDREPECVPQLEDVLAIQDTSLGRSSHLLEALNALQRGRKS